MSLIKRALVAIAVAVFAIPAAHSQTREQLKAENAQLKAQLAGQQPAMAQAGDIAFQAESVRVGPATGFARGHVGVQASIALRNTGSQPMALNYEQRTFSLVDDKGYQYTLYQEHSAVYYKESIKGISMATSSSADTADILSPGQTRSVTFIAVRYMRDGESPGTRFDLTATFGQYADVGEGRVRKLRTYPVTLHDIAASGQAADAATAIKRGLNRLFGH